MLIGALFFFISNNLFFIKGLYSEDIPWFINLLDNTEKCLFVNDYIYAYRQVEGSDSITHRIGKKNIDSLLWIINNELDNMEARSIDETAKKSLFSFLAYELCVIMSFLQYLPKGDYKSRYKEVKKLAWLLDNTANPKVKQVHGLYKCIGLFLTMKFLQLYLRKWKK